MIKVRFNNVAGLTCWKLQITHAEMKHEQLLLLAPVTRWCSDNLDYLPQISCDMQRPSVYIAFRSREDATLFYIKYADHWIGTGLIFEDESV